MQAIDKARFYAIIGKLDVHPAPLGKWDNGFLTHWKLRDGTLVAISKGESYRIAERLLK
jgi:hypothetical protein